MYAIVDLITGQVVPQVGTTAKTFLNLRRVRFPDGSVVFSPTAGYVLPPQYGEEGEPAPTHKLLNVVYLDTGSGPAVTSQGEPTYDAPGDRVTVAQTLEEAPPPPTDDEQIIAWLADNKFAAALIRALDKPVGDPKHLPPNANLGDAAVITKIKANLL